MWYCFGYWQSIPSHSPANGVNDLQAVVFEIVITFGLVYTVYATAVDPKKGSLGIIAPIAIGFVVGANILAAGPFSGGSMNPARSFGPAVVSGDLAANWIYWVGPLIGGGLAGLIYGDVFIGSYAPVPASETYPWASTSLVCSFKFHLCSPFHVMSLLASCILNSTLSIIHRLQ